MLSDWIEAFHLKVALLDRNIWRCGDLVSNMVHVHPRILVLQRQDRQATNILRRKRLTMIHVVRLLLRCLLICDFIIILQLWLVIHQLLVRFLPLDHLLEPTERVDLGRHDLQIHYLIRFCGLPLDGRLIVANSASSRHSAGLGHRS